MNTHKTHSDAHSDVKEIKIDKNPANRDPITGAPGSHPVGTGVGAATGGVAGAAIGAVGGPAGVVAGAAIGAVAGGLIGKSAGEAIDPTVEYAYWEKTFPTRPYATGATYVEYVPAYRYGWEKASTSSEKSFDKMEESLSSGWDKVRGKSTLTWDKAKFAVKDAWDRMTTSNDKTHNGHSKK